MATSITALDATEGYTSGTTLTQAELNAMVESIEAYVNASIRLNMIQLAKDVMTDSYAFNDPPDGVQSVTTPVLSAAAFLAQDETITGAWTFSGAVVHSAAVSSTSTFSSTGQDATKVTDTAAQTLANTTLTALTFDTESYDRTAMHSVASNTNRLTIPAGATGVYLFIGQVTLVADATGYRTLALYKNGSKISEVKEFAPHATEQTVLRVTESDSATALDYYELRVYQSSGGTLDTVLGATSTYFSALRVW